MAISKIGNKALGAGTVLQVVQVVKTDTFSTQSAPFVDITGLSASITPSTASSKILVAYTTNFCSDTSFTGYVARLVRDATAIFVGDAAGSRPRATMSGATVNNYSPVQVSGQYLDSPATTSSVTYKLQASCSNGSPLLYVNRSIADRDTTYYDARDASSIILMEIAG